ncbi:ComEC/Rec2 family competence protein [Novosphingobium sp. ST904]|uniref:ComEC/Rec2 family competence protein n=2 Tax=Novosphingobium sp. ST904 TaxID=1684385 RepID=UPI0006C87F98|nr:ComEC/Rec2 family competence protein [Novosphingobium sp. ST904]KPH63374.1 metal-binding protein [Novosphingobium sp. ST904]
MASQAATSLDSEHPDLAGTAALQHRPWISQSHLSSSLAGVECFLSNCGFARGPWLTVAFGTGITAWFFLPTAEEWVTLCVVCVAVALFALYCLQGATRMPYIRQAMIACSLLVMAGCLVVWARSETVGQPAIARPLFGTFTARVLAIEEQPALKRDRRILALREPGTGRPIKVRVNLPASARAPALSTGAIIRFRGRLMPPAPPMLPGAYDFARAAWFAGISATGAVLSPVEVLSPGAGDDWLGEQRMRLSRHIAASLEGSAGGIASALVTGDMGGIGKAEAQAMRDAGLAHLLSISGLHVSAVVGAVYILALRLLALSPALALRVRLPVLASASGALAGVGYTLLSGSQVPTIRSCVSALLVLAALAMGREALSMRLLAAAAFIVLLIWPESIVGASFQMSFAAVVVLIALGNAVPIRHWFSARDEALPFKALRSLSLILVTGVAIELALMPIGLYHFHRAGLYGSIANVVAIPLTTFLVMPLVGAALLFDIVGAGSPVWWLAGIAIDLLIGLARFIASRPGAVSMAPTMGGWQFLLFVTGGLWLGLWHGKARLWGLLPVASGFIGLLLLTPPDIVVSGDGRQVALIDGPGRRLVMLRDSSSDYVLDNLMEVAGVQSKPVLLAEWPGTRCNPDFCALMLERGGKARHILIARGRDIVPEDTLARACRGADLVIAGRRLPRSCRPTWLKADRNMLSRTGGVAIDLEHRTVHSVADAQGDHGWWRSPPLSYGVIAKAR